VCYAGNTHGISLFEKIYIYQSHTRIQKSMLREMARTTWASLKFQSVSDTFTKEAYFTVS
jgi:hypothetical protein